MEKLQDKTAVITGSSSGIGEAIAIQYAKAGARVVITYCQSKQKAEAVKAKIQTVGGKAIISQADVSNASEINALINQATAEFGEIDIWVNNAGADILTGAAAAQTRAEKLAALIQVDLLGTMQACWKIAPIMKQQGHGIIINNSWDLAIHGLPGVNPQMFAATKAGILGFSRCLAHDFAPEVRINIISPGWIKTAFAEQDMEQEYFRARLNEIPLHRFGKPEDIAHVALFLASEDSSYLTGEEIKVNGGLI